MSWARFKRLRSQRKNNVKERWLKPYQNNLILVMILYACILTFNITTVYCYTNGWFSYLYTWLNFVTFYWLLIFFSSYLSSVIFLTSEMNMYCGFVIIHLEHIKRDFKFTTNYKCRLSCRDIQNNDISTKTHVLLNPRKNDSTKKTIV